MLALFLIVVALCSLLLLHLIYPRLVGLYSVLPLAWLVCKTYNTFVCIYFIYIYILSTPFYFRRALSSSLFLSFPFLSFPPRFGSPFRERGCSPSIIYLACPVNGTGEGHVCARVRA